MNLLVGKFLFWFNKIIKRNSYYRSRLVHKFENSNLWGLGIFVLRGKSLDLGLLDPSKNFLLKHNFNILDARKLTNSETARISKNMRGSDWKDGLPVALLVVFDKNPVRIDSSLVHKYPELDNHNLLIKLEMRKFLNSKVKSDNISNFVHATDNSFKALNYLSIISERYKNKIIDSIKSLK